MTQYSIHPKRSAIRVQAVYFLHSTMPSVTCLRLNDVNVICRVTYFQFPIQSVFPYVGRQAAPALRRTIGFDTQYRTSDVEENVVRYLSCAERTSQGKDFELILTLKMETRHPIEGEFDCEFLAICNHCGVMTAWSYKTWKFCEQFLRFFWKSISYGKIFKICSESFHRLTDRRCCVEISSNFSDVKSAKSNVIYLKTKKFGCLSNSRYCTDRAQNLPGPAPTMCSQCSRFHPHQFTFGGVIVERVNIIFAP